MRQKVLKDALEASRKAIAETGDIAASHKSSANDILTTADLASEKAAREVITWHTGDDFISEEDPKSHKKITDPYWSGWIIDPIDGTNNFARGIPYYAISLAYVKEGIPAIGGILDPVHDELWFAEKGRGAMRNTKPIHVGEKKSLTEGVRVCSSNSLDPAKTAANLSRYNNLSGVWVDFLSSAALNFCYVADGRLDLYHHNGLKPWDNAAGFLIASEAGAKTLSFAGEKSSWHSEEMIVGNAWLCQEFINKTS